MLEQKDVLLGSYYSVGFFETENVRGYIGSGSTIHEDEKTSLFVSAWDNNNNYMHIYIDYKTEHAPMNEVETFLSSFRYIVGPSPTNLRYFGKLALDAVGQHPNFVNDRP
jgi:hypothetical protein